MTSGRALVVDPGKATGWGFLDWDTATGRCAFAGGELTHAEFIDWTARVFASPDTPDPVLGEPVGQLSLVVCEGFSITQRTVKEASDDRSLWSVKQIGHLETLCRWYAIPFVRQMPSDKSFDADGAKLKTLGWWAPSPGVKGEKGHRRDAGRHAVKYAVDHHLIDLRRLLA